MFFFKKIIHKLFIKFINLKNSNIININKLLFLNKFDKCQIRKNQVKKDIRDYLQKGCL